MKFSLILWSFFALQIRFGSKMTFLIAKIIFQFECQFKCPRISQWDSRKWKSGTPISSHSFYWHSRATEIWTSRIHWTKCSKSWRSTRNRNILITTGRSVMVRGIPGLGRFASRGFPMEAPEYDKVYARSGRHPEREELYKRSHMQERHTRSHTDRPLGKHILCSKVLYIF